MNRNLGDEIIAELGRRRMHGFYLTYEQYTQLHSVRSLDDLRDFLRASGLRDVTVDGDDPVRFVDALQSASRVRHTRGSALMIVGDLFLFGLPRLIRFLRSR